MAVSLAISEIYSVKEWPDHEIWVWGRSKSLKMTQFDRPYATFYCSPIVNNISLSCTIFQLFKVEWYRDLEIRVRGHSRSLKLVPVESMGAVSYWQFTVTGRIFRRQWDIGLQCQRMAWPSFGVVQGRRKWRRSIYHYTTFYWSAIVSIALSCTVCELSGVE